MRIAPYLALILAPPLLAAPALAQQTHYVPDDFPSITAAIGAAQSGDEILVRPGDYPENLDFMGKQLSLRSTQGASVTTISGGGADTLINLSGCPQGTEVVGFTLTGGHGRTWGSDNYGGAVCAYWGTTARVAECLIWRNGLSTGTFGGGIWVSGSDTVLQVEHCVIAQNYAWASGGGTLADHGGQLYLSRCTIADNNSTSFLGHQGGVSGANDGDTYLIDCIVWGNSGAQIEAFNGYSAGVTFTVEYSDVQGGYTGIGNIDQDPLFVSPLADDYSLQPGSPCIDGGNPASAQDPDGSPADMGAYPFPTDRVGSFQFLRAHLGQTASTSYGHAIRLGDLNNDGVSEYGVSDLNLPVLDLFDGATGQPIQSFTATGSTFGIAGTSHPDITGDGIPEYAIGEPGYQGTLVNEGRVWVYSGADHSLTRTIDPPASVASDPQFGSRVLEFVDINGDGVSEFLATSLRGGSADIYAGSLTCFDGATSASIYSVDGLEAYDQFVSIADLGPDLDGDGVPEIAVGAREAFNTGDGYVSILSGATGQALRTIDGFGGINDHFGNAYCWTSDQDGDGLEDLVIGAPDNDFYGPEVGRVGVYSSGTGALIREIVPPADVQTAFGAGWRSRYLRLPDSDGDGKEEVLFAGRSVLRNGVEEGVVYVCSPTTGQILEELLCPIGPMPGFGVQSQILGASSDGGLLLVLGGSNRSGSGVSGAFVYEYSTADSDQDDDGLADATEASIHGTDPLLFDTDGDGLGDGMELGVTVGTPDTDPAVFVPDADPLTTTDPLLADTDSGGVPDGVEDQNRDGRVDTWETDPASAADDSPAFYVSNLSPNQSVNFEAYGAEPLAVLIPAYSVRGPGPTALGIGISVNLSLPISTLPTAVAGVDGRASWTGPKVPGGISLGTPVWLQMVEIPFSGAAPRASNPLLLPIGAN